MRIFILFIFFLLFSHKLISNDIYEYAQKIVKEVSQNLPLRSTENMIMMSIESKKETVSIFNVINGNRKDLEDYAKSEGVGIEYFKSYWQNYTKKRVCKIEMLKDFVKLGGKIKYIYDFTDGDRFMSTLIYKC